MILKIYYTLYSLFIDWPSNGTNRENEYLSHSGSMTSWPHALSQFNTYHMSLKYLGPKASRVPISFSR